ncbi:MAG: DUF1800 domain-containing protein [Acidobacteriota bacterium]|nr:DUF1800 domain-containing protein [Acidobacteriota bacterium]
MSQALRSSTPGDRLPWRAAGWSEGQAAAHLLDRFAFGPRPGEVQAVREMGLERWLEQQLAADRRSPQLETRLARLDLWKLTEDELASTFPNPGQLLMQAVAEGVLDREQVEALRAGAEGAGAQGAGAQGVGGEGTGVDRRRARRQVMEWAREQGYRSQRELLQQLMAAKLYRAVYSENQLQEVLTDFWFNHFNVSLTDNQVRPYILAYERDALRPRSLGRFPRLLEATARHPAMLLYLDNARSAAEEGVRTTFAGGRRARAARRRVVGLNENYARELLELHTLGVDGGYSQRDVVEVARAFTGWTVVPSGSAGDRVRERLERARRARGLGFVVDGPFLFRADQHDAEAKTVLGRRLAPGRGIEDGEEVLDLLASHPSTARHLARKLAARFVTDEPPAPLVEQLAQVYRRSGGDAAEMVRALAYSPHFWSPEARRQKVKSPFELAVSALRVLDAEVGDPRGVVEWVRRMGQPLYAYQAPTGFPDRGDFWVNTGALLNRMSFGMDLAAGRVRGVDLGLEALLAGREPESLTAALEAYLPILLPERELEPMLELLEPMVRSSDLAARMDEARSQQSPGRDDEAGPLIDRETDALLFGSEGSGLLDRGRRGRAEPPPPTAEERVVGVILGSPEFQRR